MKIRRKKFEKYHVPDRGSQSLLVAEALWLVQKRLRMGKVVWRAQVLIPILYMLSNTLTIN